MSTTKPKQDKMVLIFEEKKLTGLTKNADFFDYVDLAHKKYFGKEQSILLSFLENLDDASLLQKESLFRDLSIMKYANQTGCIGVDWDRFFKQNTRDLLKTSKSTIQYIKKYHPNIIKQWDNMVVKLSKELGQ